MLRSSSAPSIPQSHQSYGYEEVGGGRLIRQGPKDPSLFHTGRPDDAAGPGQYDVNADPILPRQRSGAFLRGPARQALDLQGGMTPGPGHYVAKSSVEIKSNSFNVGSSFASQTERGPSKREMKREAEGPGPCSYSVERNRRPNLREMRAELQYFGSTTERFKEGIVKPTANPNVGPGAYYQPHRKPEPPNARGFCTTQERFKGDDEKIALGPGPGDYHVAGISENTMSGPLATFSMLGNSGGLAFGTMSKRLSYPPEDGRPGPGSYALGGLSEDIVDTAPEEFDQRGRARRKPFKVSSSIFDTCIR